MNKIDKILSVLLITGSACGIILAINSNVIHMNRNDIQHYTLDSQDYCTNKFIDNNNISVHEITGMSMHPTLYQGIKVICDNSTINYREGMIVLVNGDAKYFMHRIKGVYEDYVITQGDNNYEQDKKIYKDNIQCVAIGVCY